MIEAAYLIVKCPQCGQFILSKPSKTRTCPHCGRRFPLSPAVILARASSSLDAAELIRRMKMMNKQP